MRKARSVACASLILFLLTTARAPAHVKVFVNPGWTKAPACTYAEFIVRVPNERPNSTVRVELTIPKSVTAYAVRPDNGWKASFTMDRGRIVKITWSEGRLNPREYVTFGFLAATPKTPQLISWDALQTYEDGTVVSWTGPPNAETPHSQTEITRPLNKDDCHPRGIR